MATSRDDDVAWWREALVSEIRDWGIGDDWPLDLWRPIIADSGVEGSVGTIPQGARGDGMSDTDREAVARELEEQVLNASPGQIREYAEYRDQYLNQEVGASETYVADPGRGWTDKDERKYEAIKASVIERGGGHAEAKRIAAATVNRDRAENGNRVIVRESDPVPTFSKGEPVVVRYKGDDHSGVVVRQKRDGIVIVEIDFDGDEMWVDADPRSVRRS